ncbi:hypothetical protein ACIRJS_12115 [Streptomyces sp. NPDC102340]|uniref:hypothetical protein n=1 Tax=unclassified Streptomyces TaxID=2593676 RepID=UPI003808CAFB
MLDEAAIAVATGAASNVVAYLAQGRIDAVRARVASIFRRGGAQSEAEALRVLNEDSAALLERRVGEAETAVRWAGLLTAALAAHSDARPDVDALAAANPAAKTVHIGSQNNHGTGTFIGGDNYGSISAGGSEQT